VPTHPPGTTRSLGKEPVSAAPRHGSDRGVVPVSLRLLTAPGREGSSTVAALRRLADPGLAGLTRRAGGAARNALGCTDPEHADGGRGKHPAVGIRRADVAVQAEPITARRWWVFTRGWSDALGAIGARPPAKANSSSARLARTLGVAGTVDALASDADLASGALVVVLALRRLLTAPVDTDLPARALRIPGAVHALAVAADLPAAALVVVLALSRRGAAAEALAAPFVVAGMPLQVLADLLFGFGEGAATGRAGVRAVTDRALPLAVMGIRLIGGQAHADERGHAPCCQATQSGQAR
jgi:hypothetical protein